MICPHHVLPWVTLYATGMNVGCYCYLLHAGCNGTRIPILYTRIAVESACFHAAGTVSVVT